MEIDAEIYYTAGRDIAVVSLESRFMSRKLRGKGQLCKTRKKARQQEIMKREEGKGSLNSEQDGEKGKDNHEGTKITGNTRYHSEKNKHQKTHR